MLRIGLTGGIGAGKSMVARRLAGLGAVVIDADLLAREVVEPGTAGLAAVVRAFGDDVLAADGSLDRGALGARVFADEDVRRTLNGILHPRIAALTKERLAALPGDAIAVHDVPLLVENRLGDDYHLVLVVHAPVTERIRRLAADRGMTESDARSRVAAQADDAARRAAADVLLDNTGAPEEVQARVDRFWACRAVAFERNLRERRPAPLDPRATVAAPDPGWAGQGARLAARVTRALGDRAVRVEHVGPTAVPGLAARDVVELRAFVEFRAFVEGGIGDDVDERLVSAGFVGAEVTGMYRSADPGRIAVLTVHPSTALSGR